MHRWPFPVLLVLSLLAACVTASSPASADHEDLIAAKIAPSTNTFALEPFADGFAVPIAAVVAPYNTSQIFVADLVGTITAVPTDSQASTAPRPRVLLDIGPNGADLLVDQNPNIDERGLLGLAFDPHYRKTGLFYTYTSEPLGPTPDFTTLAESDRRDDQASLSVIREWKVDEPRSLDAQVDPAGSRILLSIEQPQKNHNGGDLAFGPDAMLYVALGDGGSSDDEGIGHGPEGNGQDLGPDNLLGKILRIDPRGTNGRNGQYGVPADNPFAGQPGADETFAYGFRNPYRLSFDHGTGALIAADVGQHDVEEVNLVVAGGNYGWPVKEGTWLFNNNGPTTRGNTGENSPGTPIDMIDPIAQYDHDEGISITGGYVYRGSVLPSFEGMYVFGDWTMVGGQLAGRFFQMSPTGVLSEVIPANNDDHRLVITAFGRDTAGELYVLGQQSNGSGGRTGVVLKLVPAG